MTSLHLVLNNLSIKKLPTVKIRGAVLIKIKMHISFFYALSRKMRIEMKPLKIFPFIVTTYVKLSYKNASCFESL